MMKSCFVIISFSVCRRKDPFAEDEGGKWDVYEAAVGDDWIKIYDTGPGPDKRVPAAGVVMDSEKRGNNTYLKTREMHSDDTVDLGLDI